MSENNTIEQPATNTTVIVNQLPPKKNGMGTTGFVLALLGIIFCWVPVVGWILWVLGLIFSIVGMFKKPKGLAIAGLIISCISLIVLIILATVVGAALMTM